MLGRIVTRPLSDRRRSPGPALRVASLVTTLSVAFAVAAVAAGHSAADTVRTRASYQPRTTSGWRNDTSLGRTARADQYAQASVAGLVDGRHAAGFRMRYAHRNSQILVAVSRTGWIIQPAGRPAMTGSFPHGTSGRFRAEIEGSTVRLLWNGALVATRRVVGSYPGRHVVTTVRQPSPQVTVTGIRASSLPTPRPGGHGPAPARPIGTWWSGAAGAEAASGSFGAWRGSAVQIGGTWTDTYDAQIDQWMICEGPWARWTKPLDLAVGAIFADRGETWAAAAKGAYTARWTTALRRVRACWGNRDPARLYLRFAHEMNLSSSRWAVRRGEEEHFRTAMRIFSDLRYEIIPGARLVLCVNDGTDAALGGLDVRRLWPGRDARGRPIADVYAADSYNFWPHVTTPAQFAAKINTVHSNGAPKGIERHRQYAARLGVPFAVSEWSNQGRPGAPGGGGESEVYVREFNAWARRHAGNVDRPRPGQLLYEIHFNLWTEYSFWPKTVQPRTATAYRSLRWGR